MALIRQKLAVALVHLALTVILIGTLYPLAWVAGTSLNPGNTLLISDMLPRHPTLEHFARLLRETDFILWYRNTLEIASANMLLSTLLVTASAYAFARFRFKGRRGGLVALLVLQMFPGFLSIMAIFVLLLQTGLLNTFLGLILIYSGGSISFGVWVMKGYFDSLPRSIEEAAIIDGAGRLQVLGRILLPLSAPALTFVMLTSFIGPVMDFILPQIVLRSSEKMTLAQGLYGMVSDKMNSSFSLFAAGSVLAALPITLLYMAFQRFLIHGLSAGADKG